MCAVRLPQDIAHFAIVVVICVVMTAMMVNIVFGVRVQAVASPGDAISRMFECERLDHMLSMRLRVHACSTPSMQRCANFTACSGPT